MNEALYKKYYNEIRSAWQSEDLEQLSNQLTSSIEGLEIIKVRIKALEDIIKEKS